MKTKIIIKTGWRLIAEYSRLFTMSNGDIVDHKDIEYKVECCIWDTKDSTMTILVDA